MTPLHLFTPLEPGSRSDPARLDRSLESVVVAFVLVGVGLGKVGDCPVEGVRLAEVGGDRDPVAGAGMRAGECPAARLSVRGRARRDGCLEGEGALPVLELADVEVALLAVEAGADVLPAEEDVARSLHQALAGDDAPAAILVLAAQSHSGTPSAARTTQIIVGTSLQSLGGELSVTVYPRHGL